MRPSTILTILAVVVWVVFGGLAMEQPGSWDPPGLTLFAGLVAVTVTMLWAASQVYVAISRRMEPPVTVPPAWAAEFARHAQAVAGRYVSRPVPVYGYVDSGESTQRMETGSAVALMERTPESPSLMDDPAYWLAYGHFAEDLLSSLGHEKDQNEDGAETVQ